MTGKDEEDREQESQPVHSFLPFFFIPTLGEDSPKPHPLVGRATSRPSTDKYVAGAVVLLLLVLGLIVGAIVVIVKLVR